MVAACGVVCATACRDTRADAPNVLVIVMDTTRADRCAVAGGRPGTTPSLDRLAADGVTFLDAWSPGGWTAPSHASLFSGLLPDRHQVEHGMRMFLDPQIPTIATELRAAGWETACFSNNEMVGPATGLSSGFGVVEQLYAKPWRAYPYAPETHRMALDWIRGVAKRGGRFFAFVNDMEPHLSYRPPADLQKRFLPSDATYEEIEAGRAFDFPETLKVIVGRRKLSAREREILLGLYDAEIASLDAEIGAMLDTLRAEGLLDRTLVVVCGDHGENIGDHGLADHRFSLHRSIRHVPLVIRGPGGWSGGRRVTATARLQDVFPTVLEACGVPVPAGLDGRPLAPLAVGTDGARRAPAVHGPVGSYVDRMREVLPGEDFTPFLGSWRAQYDGKLHLIRRSDGQEEIYDIASDPDETRNLVGTDVPSAAPLRKDVTPPK